MMDDKPTPIEGQCLCGAVQVRIEPKEPHLHACHCGMCRRWTGAAFLGISVPPGGATASGPVRTRAFSEWAQRAWCDECGSPLWYEVTAEGPVQGTRFVAAGLFENAGGFALASEIYIDRKPEGYAFAGDHPVKTQAEVEAEFAAPPAGDAQ